MIVKNVKATPFAWNVGRPNIFCDDDRRFWKAFHDLIDKWPQPIIVNASFDFIVEMLESETGYGGGGFSYTFWFVSEQDVQDFKAAAKLL